MNKWESATDELEWIEETSDFIKKLNIPEISATGIFEYLQEQAEMKRDEVFSRLTTLVMHLLKGRFQPEKQRTSKSWTQTCNRERAKLSMLCRKTNLKNYLDSILESNEYYPYARKQAEVETGKKMPIDNPFTPEEILDSGFYG